MVNRSKFIEDISLDEMEKKHYDVLIVGSGAGGGALLWRLCKNWKREERKKIGIIEKGKVLFSTNYWNSNNFSFEKYKNMASQSGKNLPNFSGATQIFALGGKTLFWSAVTPRFHFSELKKWPISIKDLNSYYLIAERIMNVSLSTSNSQFSPQSILNFLNQHGFQEAIRTPKAISYDSKKNRLGKQKLFSSIDFLIEGKKQRSFDLALNACATKVNVEKNKKIGIEVKSGNKEYYLYSKNIVLSMGTLETPRILLHSGIQGNALGHFLTHHSYVRAIGKHESSFIESILIPETVNNPFQIQLNVSNKKS
ncbi:hypothetical protein GCM10009865_38330 [Aeromicrobium ponti]|uniref:Gluconate 5-dehydrogenase n=1 Tax=Cytobacillus oceanisediminis TaxID=665099 RepID=A0A562JJI2_9BACI|nr:GMC family oxidoreductase N-terminal domain-containing protein [Cytobacillus oceanisediminis]TWH83165.1 gluconate 5-dehydrogenase [Cytobacillus oceanisediminis]